MVRAGGQREAGSGKRKRGSSRCAGLDEAEYVALGDASGDAGALERGNVHSVLRCDFSNQRRGFRANSVLERVAVSRVRSRKRGCVWLLTGRRRKWRGWGLGSGH